MISSISIFALVLIIIASLIVIILDNFRYRLIAMASIYLAEFILVALVWPVGLASIKFVIGIICVIILYSADHASDSQDSARINTSYRMLKAVITILIWLMVFYFSNQLLVWVPTSQNLIKGSLTLIGMGIIQVGITSDTKSVILGLLMFFAGFEVLYSAIETSVLLAGLLALVNFWIISCWFIPVINKRHGADNLNSPIIWIFFSYNCIFDFLPEERKAPILLLASNIFVFNFDNICFDYPD